MTRIRLSTIRVTDAQGVTWEGEGENLALAVRDLGRRHRAGAPGPDQGETRWRLTPKGEAAVRAMNAAEALADAEHQHRRDRARERDPWAAGERRRLAAEASGAAGTRRRGRR